MVSRYTGACLGLLAFAIVTVSGMVVHNPPMVTLSRAVAALVIFCILGLAVGACAQCAVNEHHRRREAEELPSATDTGSEGTEQAASGGDSEAMEAEVMGT
jgi:hypothetical protein